MNGGAHRYPGMHYAIRETEFGPQKIALWIATSTNKDGTHKTSKQHSPKKRVSC